MSSRNDKSKEISRRKLLKGMGMAPLLFRTAPFGGLRLFASPPATAPGPVLPYADIRLRPHYPAQSPLVDLLRLVPTGSDNYPTERCAEEIENQLRRWGQSLTSGRPDSSSLATWLDPVIEASSLIPIRETLLRSGCGVEVVRKEIGAAVHSGRELFLAEIDAWLGTVAQVETAEFEIYGVEQIGNSPLAVHTAIRYDIAANRHDGVREERVGSWRVHWISGEAGQWKARQWRAGDETCSTMRGPAFTDVTDHAMRDNPSWKSQLAHGADYWRTVLDGACGIDVYNNSGVAVGDFDNDGWDDFYVCQPAGLPNRLYRNRCDGTFEDVTDKAGVGLLDGTACALFADFRNVGLQDLLVVTAAGPLLFLNRGNGTFSVKRDAFRFARPPQGSFTHAAAADYDRDGRIDLYLCTYMYYLGLDQYHYPIPYYDARNGPPNCLMHNEGNGAFVETTEAAGLSVENNRYSFACAWGDSRGNGLPDLFVANDFGTSQLYRNNGSGTFSDASKEAGVEGVGAGMSCAWSDFDNSGHLSAYVASMWEAAGQRVSQQEQFHADAPENIRALYRRHARGNALYCNQGDGSFRNVGHEARVDMGRWSWCSDFWDFDHDGYADLYVANGYISGPDRNDLASFFWRQVVAKSPEDAEPFSAYERGWGAINELIRSDSTWNGYERNVLFANNRDGTFSEVSAPAGLDFRDDSRAFALADLDHDGRLEIILKNRNAPQLRVLHNAMQEIGASIVFRLRGQSSNRDALGSAVTVEAGTLRQTKYLQAGSGFLAQHSKELLFGLGKVQGDVLAIVRWPGGLTQSFDHLPVNHRIQLEEGSKSFTAQPFSAPPSAWARPGPPSAAETLPREAQTWLLEPLLAPEFSAPDASGRPHDLRALRGSFVLLNFWGATNPQCLAHLASLELHRSRLSSARIEILAVNVDDTEGQRAAKLLVAREGALERLTIPVVFAPEEVAGIYNIVYRYLFDRRRDLGIPTSFLVDPQGRIVKVYQGAFDPAQLLEDANRAPSTTADRMKRALPFRGDLLQGPFLRNDFTYGVALFQHGYLDQAEASFQEVLARRPDDPEACYNLGTLNLRRGNPQQARLYLRQTVKLRPDYPEAWNNLGMIAAQEGDGEEAIRDFGQALLFRPGYEVALLNLGNIYRRQEDFTRSEKYLQQAAAAQPDDPEVSYSLGMLYAVQEQMQKAAEYLSKAIALRPDYPQALNNLGVLLVHLQDYGRAETQFRTCIRLEPAFDQSYLNLASLYVAQGQKQQAMDVLGQLLFILPDDKSAQQAMKMLKSAR